MDCNQPFLNGAVTSHFRTHYDIAFLAVYLQSICKTPVDPDRYTMAERFLESESNFRKRRSSESLHPYSLSSLQ